MQARCALEAEMLGIMMNMWLARLRNLQSFFLVEGDNKAVMDALALRSKSPTCPCIQISEQILTLSTRFLFCEFRWVSRNCNQVAHHLSK